MNYWNISKLPITIDGYGVVYEQNTSSNSLVDNTSEIIVKLHEINYEEPIIEQDIEDTSEDDV